MLQPDMRLGDAPRQKLERSLEHGVEIDRLTAALGRSDESQKLPEPGGQPIDLGHDIGQASRADSGRIGIFAVQQ